LRSQEGITGKLRADEQLPQSRAIELRYDEPAVSAGNGDVRLAASRGKYKDPAGLYGTTDMTGGSGDPDERGAAEAQDDVAAVPTDLFKDAYQVVTFKQEA
jgi:hypothetical protein